MNPIRKSNLIHTLAWLAVSVFCFIVPIIYYRYSHGITSNYMTYAFWIPTAGAFLPYAFLTIFGYGASNLGRTIYQSGIITLTVGSLLTGGIEIYGTASHLTVWYFIVGGALSLIGLVWSVLRNALTHCAEAEK